jgi:hypothetical protein
MVRVPFREERIELAIFDQAVGLVVALPLLVLDDADLVLEILLGDRVEQMAHAVALEEEREVERRRRHRLEIIGPVEPGGAVIVGGADLLERLEEVARRVLGAVEHQVLEQVGEAGLAGDLVLRADVVPDRDGDDRRLVILMDVDAQAVGQREALVGDVDLADERGERRGRGGGRGRSGGGGRDHQRCRGDGGQQRESKQLTAHHDIPLRVRFGGTIAAGTRLATGC